MTYAFYPGCVSRGAAPELFAATVETCARMGIDLDFEPMKTASCTGSGVLQEKNQRLGDTLNARTFALAERSGLPLITICSTCQGVMSQANHRLKSDPAYLAEINADLAEEGLEYRGTADPRHLLWVLVEDVGLDRLKSMVVRPLTGFKVAPFYGCYLVRPSSALELDEKPERTRLAGEGHRSGRGGGRRLSGEDPVLRLPDPDGQRDQRRQDGRQPHFGRQGQGAPTPWSPRARCAI